MAQISSNLEVKVSEYGFKNSVFGLGPQITYGSVYHLAPEILTGRFSQLSDYELKKADVYSFGILLYEMCTRGSVYEDMNPMRLGMRVLKGLRPAIPKYVPDELVIISFLFHIDAIRKC